MSLFSQSQNYVSLDTLEFILKEHKDLVVSVHTYGNCYRLKLWTKDLAFFLGTTRRLLRIPLKSRYPNLWHHLAFGDNETWCQLLYIESVFSKK